MAGMWLRQATQGSTTLKIGHTWAISGGFSGPLGSSPNPLPTKSGGSISRHMAQFARITCLKIRNSCPCACSKRVDQVGGFTTVHSSYIHLFAQFVMQILLIKIVFL
jgi:hypothetical protein